MTEEPRDQLMDHEYDGIREFDNRLPNWWLYTLYGAIVFGVLYWMFFHTFGLGALPGERYELDMVAAAEAQLSRQGLEVSNETLELLSTVPDRVGSGKQIFDQFCVICHDTRGQGNVGPNLTDAYWIQGGTPVDIHRTVTEGVLDKGMAAWGDQLGPRRVMDVVGYVLTLRNTNVAGKDPEGELFDPNAIPEPVGEGAGDETAGP